MNADSCSYPMYLFVFNKPLHVAYSEFCIYFKKIQYVQIQWLMDPDNVQVNPELSIRDHLTAPFHINTDTEGPPYITLPH